MVNDPRVVSHHSFMKTQNTNPSQARRRPTELTVHSVEVLQKIFQILRAGGHPRCLKGKVSPSVAADIVCTELSTWSSERITSLLMPPQPSAHVERGKYAVRVHLPKDDTRPQQMDHRFTFRNNCWVLSKVDYPDLDLDVVVQAVDLVLPTLCDAKNGGQLG